MQLNAANQEISMIQTRKGNQVGQRARAAIGFSLIEMMVALVAGLIVSAAVIAFLLSSMKSNGEYVRSTRLTQELRNTLDLVTRDLSRAGYNDNALQFVSLPNISEFAPVFIKDDSPLVTAGLATTYTNADSRGCILYAYDRTFPIGFEDDGTCDDIAGCGTAGEIDFDRGESRGIRRVCIDGNCNDDLNDVGVIEFFESKAGLTTSTPPSCDQGTTQRANYGVYPPTCNTASGWCPLSDPKVLNITRFRIIDTSTNLAGSSMRVRDLIIYLEGRLVGDNDLRRIVSTKVKIRADCINPTIANCRNKPVP